MTLQAHAHPFLSSPHFLLTPSTLLRFSDHSLGWSTFPWKKEMKRLLRRLGKLRKNKIKGWGIVTLFGNFIKIQKVSSHQLNFKTNDLVLLLKAIWMYWNCFLLPVAMDGMDGNGLKLEKICQFFQVLMLCVPKILIKFIMVSHLW